METASTRHEAAGEERQLEAVVSSLAAWLDSIPLDGIADLRGRLREADKRSKESLPPELAAAIDNGAAKEELRKAFGTQMLQEQETRAADARERTARLAGARLSQEQLASLRARGRFENSADDSKLTKPDVWKISRLLQTGSEVRQRWYYALLVTSLNHVWVQPGMRLTGGAKRRSGLNVLSGLRNIGGGLKGIANTFVGLRVERIDEAAAVGDISKARKAFCLEAVGASLDPRLLDPLTRVFLSREWRRISEKRASDWALREESGFVEETVNQIRAKYSSQEGVSENGLAAEVRALSRAEEACRLAIALSEDDVIEKHSPGLGKLLARHVEASWALSAALFKLQTEQEQVCSAKLHELQEQHPVLSHLEPWREEKLARAEGAWRKALAWKVLEDAEAILGAIGEREARLIAADKEWRQSQLPGLKKRARSERAYKRPVYITTTPVRIWGSQNFLITKTDSRTGDVATWRLSEAPRHPEDIENGLLGPESKSADQLLHALSKHDWKEAASSHLFWRMLLLYHRTLRHFKNGVHYFAGEFWNGSFGVRAFFAPRPLPIYTWTIQPRTGQVFRSQTALRQGFLGRLASLWSHVYRSRQQFEAEPAAGIIGKGLARPFNLVWNYLVKGALASALLLITIPALTGLNLLVSAFVIVTAPLWAPALALLEYAADVIIYDSMSERWCPLFLDVFWKLGFAGVGNIFLSLLFVALHPVIGAVMFLIGGLGLATVAAWDWLIFWGLLTWHAKVPASDGFLCRRIAGGGIGETHYIQVAPAAILLALRLHLHGMLLEAQRDALLSEADASVREVKKLEDALTPFGLIVSMQSNGMKSTRLSKIFHHAEVAKAETHREFKWRQHTLKQDNSWQRTRTLARLSREDLHRTLQIAQDLVRCVFSDAFSLLLIANGRNAAAFWKVQGFAEGDWAGLTRKLVALSVSDGVLTPLEDDVAGVHLKVEHVTPKEYVRMLVDNAVHDDLEVARVIEPSSKTAGVGSLRWRDAYTSGLTCGLNPLKEESAQVWPVDEIDGTLDDLSSFAPYGSLRSI